MGGVRGLNVREIFEKENKNYYQIKSSDDLDIHKMKNCEHLAASNDQMNLMRQVSSAKKMNKEKISPRLKNQRHES